MRRKDGLYWSGVEWVKPFSDALVYPDASDALAAFARIRPTLTEGKPTKAFACTFTVTVSGDGVAAITTADVAEYLRRALAMSIDYEAEGDSPLAPGIVECRLDAAGLKEVGSPRVDPGA